MIACYDLDKCPPTYDVVAFLAHAELERLRRGEDSIDLRILPGSAGGFRRDDFWPRSLEERLLLRERVLVPLCRLLPSVSSVSVDHSREVEGWGKGEYIISLPATVSALREGARPLRSPAKVKRDPNRIVFTLRESDHHSPRNSRVAEWAEAGRRLVKAGYQVVVVRDTVRAYEVLDGLEICPEAAVDVVARAALYASAALNVGICNGPMCMSVHMGVPTLTMRPTTSGAGYVYSDEFWTEWGVPPGSQFPTSPPDQRLVWEDDTAEAIVAAVEGMI